MASHNDLGRLGEDMVVDYLSARGYVILDRNWHYDSYELDIVAEHDDILVIVEVKTRRGETYGRPEEAVTRAKMRRTIIAADAYIKQKRIDLRVRFDVITVTGGGAQPRIEHFEDAFRAFVC